MSKRKKEPSTYIVLHRGRTAKRGCTVLGRYRVGAKNEEEALKFVKAIAGKHIKAEVYYKETNPDYFVKENEVILESGYLKDVKGEKKDEK